MAFIGKIIMGIVSIAEGSVFLVELAIKLVFWIGKLLSIAPKLLNPVYILNEGITVCTLVDGLKIIKKNIERIQNENN